MYFERKHKLYLKGKYYRNLLVFFLLISMGVAVAQKYAETTDSNESISIKYKKNSADETYKFYKELVEKIKNKIDDIRLKHASISLVLPLDEYQREEKIIALEAADDAEKAWSQYGLRIDRSNLSLPIESIVDQLGSFKNKVKDLRDQSLDIAIDWGEQYVKILKFKEEKERNNYCSDHRYDLNELLSRPDIVEVAHLRPEQLAFLQDANKALLSGECLTVDKFSEISRIFKVASPELR